jgi:hypothetical protein
MANNMESNQSESATILPGSISAPVQANRRSVNWNKYAAVVIVCLLSLAYAGATFLGQSNIETGALRASSLKGGVDL